MDWGASNRRDEFEFRLVDPFTLRETGELLDTPAGTGQIDWALDSDNLVSASMEMFNGSNRDRLVRIYQTITVGDESREVVLGTFFVDDVPANAKFGAVVRKAKMYSTLWRHTQDSLRQDFARSKGYNVVQEMRELVTGDGGTLSVLSGVDTSRKHTKDIHFELGTNKGKVLNTIAGWISVKVGVDPWGRITLSPDVDANKQAVAHTFWSGANCEYLPGVDISDTSKDAYNRVNIYYTTKDKTAKAYVDLPASHPFSYQRIGRHKTYVWRLTEEIDEEEMRRKAKKFLDENSGATTYYEIEHVSVPDVELGCTVRYVNDTDFGEPVDCKCQVEQMSMQLKPGAPCKTKLRRLD